MEEALKIKDDEVLVLSVVDQLTVEIQSLETIYAEQLAGEASFTQLNMIWQKIQYLRAQWQQAKAPVAVSEPFLLKINNG